MEFNMIFFLLLYFDYLFYFFCVIAGITAHRCRRRARRVLAAVIPQAPRHRAPLAPEVNTKVPQPNRVARAAQLDTIAQAALAAPSLVQQVDYSKPYHLGITCFFYLNVNPSLGHVNGFVIFGFGLITT